MNETRERFHVRDEATLRSTLSMLRKFIWTGKLPSGAHLWSIPVDKERDFDCVLSDGIDELVALRRQWAQLRQWLEERRKVNRCWQDEAGTVGCDPLGGICPWHQLLAEMTRLEQEPQEPKEAA